MSGDAPVTVVDLGLGNLHSVLRGLERAGAAPQVTRDADAVRRAGRLLVPGQGAFRDGARAVEGDLGVALREAVDAGVPYLGICLGMQLLFEASEEAPGAAGLGIFAGGVRRFPDSLTDAEGTRLKVPHMGWNRIASAHPLLEDGAYVYFVHSYCCAPDDVAVIAATADYGGPFCAAVARANVLACQFHPEKSQRRGEALLRRWLRDAPPRSRG
ncbi:MAG: imidazole glycerol phosphate synthase subunit HisH [Myxococcota bacterium]